MRQERQKQANSCLFYPVPYDTTQLCIYPTQPACMKKSPKHNYTKEERQAYIKRKRKVYSSSVPMIKRDAIPLYFKPVDIVQYCVKFGCGKILSNTEKLCGNTCISCQNKPQIDVTQYIKFK